MSVKLSKIFKIIRLNAKISPKRGTTPIEIRMLMQSSVIKLYDSTLSHVVKFKLLIIVSSKLLHHYQSRYVRTKSLYHHLIEHH